jgi:hypothetical protein
MLKGKNSIELGHGFVGSIFNLANPSRSRHPIIPTLTRVSSSADMVRFALYLC